MPKTKNGFLLDDRQEGAYNVPAPEVTPEKIIEAAQKTIAEARAQKMAIGVTAARIAELNEIIYDAKMIIQNARELGGAGSGFFKHKGRDATDEQGGSLPRGEGGGGSPGDNTQKSQARGHNEGSAKEILDQLRNNPGGFSFRPVNSTSANKGFMTSVQDGPIFDPNLSDEEAIKIIDQFLDEKDSLLAKKNFYVGGWLNGKDGKFYLDASANVSGFEDAMILAASTHQKAIFDLNTFNETFLSDWLEKNPGTFISQADRDWYKEHKY